jgi:hypothetical protein
MKCRPFHRFISLVALIIATTAQAQSLPSSTMPARPLAGVLDVQVRNGKGFAITSETLYQFNTEKPVEWKAVASLQSSGASGIAGIGRDGGVLIVGTKNRKGLMEPALYRWKDSMEVQFVSDLTSRSCEFTNAGVGISCDGATILQTGDDGKSWARWTPPDPNPREYPIQEVGWIGDGNFLLGHGGWRLSLVRIDRAGSRVVWQIHQNLVSPLAGDGDSLFSTALDMKSQWIQQHRILDGAVVRQIPTPFPPNRLCLTASFLVGVADNTKPADSAYVWFALKRSNLATPIKKLTSQSKLAGVAETPKGELWLFFADGSTMRGDQENAALNLVRADNSAVQKFWTEKRQAESPTPEQAAEVQRLLLRVKGQAKADLLAEMSKQPGAPRQRAAWLIEKLKALPEPPTTTQRE